MLQSGGLRKADADALLQLARLDKSFTYNENSGITALAGANSAIQKELSKLSA